MNNLLNSVIYLEFVNNITSLINNLLYSPQEGYVLLNSKDAIFGCDKVVEKFNHEVNKISKNVCFDDLENLIDQKRNDLIKKINEHRNSQISVWIDEVFNSLKSNLIFEISIDKNNTNVCYNSFLRLLDWYCRINSYDEKLKHNLLSDFNSQMQNVLKTSDDDFLYIQNETKSVPSVFLKYWDMILLDCENFKKIDFNQEMNSLSIEDIKYFQTVQLKLRNYKKIVVFDELKLINSAIELMKLDKIDDKYQFIKNIQDDISSFGQNGSKMLENDLIEIVKRRMQLFSQKQTNTSDYFKNKLSILK